MIRLFIYILLTLVTGLLATLFLAREPGYLLISFGGASFETSLFALFVAIIALLILLRLVLLILDWINPMRLVYAGRSWSQARAEKRERNAPPPEEELRAALEQELSEQAEANGEVALTPAQLRKLWKKRTRKLTTDDALICVYADALANIDALPEALKTLEKSLEGQWSDVLIRKYSLLGLRSDDKMAVQQLQKAEAWLVSRGQDPVLLLALGRLSLRNQLWGKARDYLERSLQTRPDYEVFAELARLLQNLKEPERSARYLQGPTGLISHDLPDFPQPGKA